MTILPLALNLYKGVIAGILLFVTILWLGHGWQGFNSYGVSLLLLSGMIGIGIGDTAFFAALNRLGERPTLLIAETIAPPISIVLAYLFINERIALSSIVGIVITLLGVAWVILERSNNQPGVPKHRRHGLQLAMVAAISQAIGAVLSREAFIQSDISPLVSSLIRLLGSTAFLILWMHITRRTMITPSIKSKRVIIFILVAAFLGTYLGIYFQQLSFKHTSAAIALTLFATSSLFVLLIAVIRREKVTIRSGLGALVAVLGVSVIFDKKAGFDIVEILRFW